MSVLALAVGLVLLLAVLQDAFEVMLLPRRVQRRVRFVRLYFRQSWRLASAMARRLPVGARRERRLGVFAPLATVVLFGTWAVGLILACGLIDWALHADAGDKALTLARSLYLSGVTFFTVGYGDLTPGTTPARALAVFEAGLGLGFIAAVISYLPVLYQLFSHREAHVIALDGRAGSPPTAGGMILRHARGGDLAQLDAVLREWETLGAELLESQLSYPMLALYRSQHDDQSWLAALACVMDACALVLVGVEALPPLQARMTFAMARQVLVEMASASRCGRPTAATSGSTRTATRRSSGRSSMRTSAGRRATGPARRSPRCARPTNRCSRGWRPSSSCRYPAGCLA